MDIDDLIKLPKGLYLFSYVREETRKEGLNHLLIETKNNYKYVTDFIVQTIIISGILHWDYQIELLIKPL